MFGCLHFCTDIRDYRAAHFTFRLLYFFSFSWTTFSELASKHSLVKYGIRALVKAFFKNACSIGMEKTKLKNSITSAVSLYFLELCPWIWNPQRDLLEIETGSVFWITQWDWLRRKPKFTAKNSPTKHYVIAPTQSRAESENDQCWLLLFCCYQGRLSARHPPCQQSGWEPQQGTAVLGDRSTPSPSGTTAARRATTISTN